MKFLFIKLNLIGDAFLLTGTARALKRLHPQAEIHAVVRKGTEAILVGCPDISKVYVAGDKSGGALAGMRRNFGLIRALRKEHYSHAFEFGDADRGRILSVLSGAKRRYANSSEFKKTHIWQLLMRQSEPMQRQGLHAATWDLNTVALAFPQLRSQTPPQAVFEASAADFGWVDALGLKDAAVFVHPVASRPGKMWTLEGWIAVVRHILSLGHPVILSSGPAAKEVELCQQIAAAVGSDQVFVTQGQLPWQAVAGAMRRSLMYVGTDTAAMHLAAASGLPIVALFAHPPESLQSIWYPICKHSRLISPPKAEQALTVVKTAEVIAAVSEFGDSCGLWVAQR